MTKNQSKMTDMFEEIHDLIEQRFGDASGDELYTLAAEIYTMCQQRHLSQERALWWQEVTDPDLVIPAGCPLRVEYLVDSGVEVEEGAKDFDREVSDYMSNIATVFIDMRWRSNGATYKVGDVIKSCTANNIPNDGVGLVDYSGEIWRVHRGRIHGTLGGSSHWRSDLNQPPYTVIYVPEEGEEK